MHHICTSVHLDLISIRRQVNITNKIFNLLVFLFFSMMWSATVYAKSSPFLFIILHILIILSLGYLAIAQSRHIKQLGDMINHLCMDSPFNDPEREDQLMERGKHQCKPCSLLMLAARTTGYTFFERRTGDFSEGGMCRQILALLLG